MLALTGLMLLDGRSAVLAADPTSTSAPADSDKAQYTLFNPTPAAQLREMDTDRPNVTNTPHTIDAGHLQIETGLVDYVHNRSHVSGSVVKSDNLALAESDFRLGISNNLEINVVIDPYQIDRTNDATRNETTYARGFGDTVVGGKLNFWGNDAGDRTWASGLAIQPQFKFPTASDSVGNGHFECSFAFPFLMNLPSGFHLGLQTGASLERNTTNDGDVAGMQNAISIDRVVISNLDIYLEYASNVTTQNHVEAVQSIDVGGTYPLNDNIVLDTGLAFGLNKASNNFELLAGISLRF
jgi:hypothetical protein